MRSGSSSPNLPKLAHDVSAARIHYDAKSAAQAAEEAGVYLIGRVVVFADPTLGPARTELALQWPDGSAWRDPAGLAWLNPYDRRVWRYVVDVAAAAAKAGFDEIQFDYVRFPSDGDIDSIVYPMSRRESKERTIERFLAYASGRLRPLGVRVSADLFGLAATRDLGVGQSPKRLRPLSRRDLPDGLSVALRARRVPPDGSGGVPRPDGGGIPSRLPKAVTRHERPHRPVAPGLLPQPHVRPRRGDGPGDGGQAVDANGFMLWNPLGVYTQEALSLALMPFFTGSLHLDQPRHTPRGHTSGVMRKIAAACCPACARRARRLLPGEAGCAG